MCCLEILDFSGVMSTLLQFKEGECVSIVALKTGLLSLHIELPDLV